jgi:asparagine synthetase B (glutamine-hydrolysing)
MANIKYIFPKLEWYTPFIRDEIIPIVQDRIYDRTGTVYLGWDQHIVSPIPVYAEDNTPFSQICEATAAGIGTVSSKENKRITVTWSGGLDSTAVVTSFLMNQQKIDITMSSSAELEWPEFAHYIKSHPLVENVIEFEFLPHMLMREGKDRVWIGGDPGDLLYGGKIDWDGKKHRDWFQSILDKCPYPLATLESEIWWLGFVLLWQSHCIRIHMIARQHIPNFINFYDNERFQQWAMSAEFSPLGENKYDYKTKNPTKEHIFKLFAQRTVWQQKKRDSIHGVVKDPLDYDFTSWLRTNMYSFTEPQTRKAKDWLNRESDQPRMMALHVVAKNSTIDENWRCDFPPWSELVNKWQEEKAYEQRN